MNGEDLIEMCCVIFANILSNKKSVEFIQGRGELDQYLKLFYELLDKNSDIKLACIDVIFNMV